MYIVYLYIRKYACIRRSIKASAEYYSSAVSVNSLWQLPGKHVGSFHVSNLLKSSLGRWLCLLALVCDYSERDPIRKPEHSLVPSASVVARTLLLLLRVWLTDWLSSALPFSLFCFTCVFLLIWLLLAFLKHWRNVCLLINVFTLLVVPFSVQLAVLRFDWSSPSEAHLDVFFYFVPDLLAFELFSTHFAVRIWFSDSSINRFQFTVHSTLDLTDSEQSQNPVRLIATTLNPNT